MREQSLTGFVLRRYNLGEADRIISFYSLEKGKVKLVAKGIRKGKAKLSGHLEPYCLIDIRVVGNKSLATIIGAEARELFNFQSIDEEILMSAHLINEIMDKMLPEDQPNESAYDLYVECISEVREVDPQLLRQYFSLKLLVCLGSQPELGGTVAGSRHYLSYDSGEVVPFHPNSHYGIISDKTIKFWRLVYKNPLEQLARISGIDEIFKESEKLIFHYYEYHFGLRFKSLGVFQERQF